MKARWRWCAVAGFALLLSPPARQALESRMALHMLVQVPLLIACGVLLGSGFSAAWRERLDRWNSHGIAGLFAFALVTAVLMIPRVLDLSVANVWIDVIKALVLLASGIALYRSWTRAGALVQASSWGSVLPMTAAVGQAYQGLAAAPVQRLSARRPGAAWQDARRGPAILLAFAWLLRVAGWPGVSAEHEGRSQSQLAGSSGMEKEKLAPGPSFGSAQRRP